MLKKSILLILALLLLVSFGGCGEKKILHCDNCNTEVKVDADSNMTEDWIIYCNSCNEALGLDTVVEDYEDIYVG
ncbi:MAG: hypothetical protein IKT46_04535 [Clostridia bacterium]|nr:hypothetical protein [Clostridia bacterium]